LGRYWRQRATTSTGKFCTDIVRSCFPPHAGREGEREREREREREEKFR
jgi:hypothetical protein